MLIKYDENAVTFFFLLQLPLEWLAVSVRNNRYGAAELRPRSAV